MVGVGETRRLHTRGRCVSDTALRIFKRSRCHGNRFFFGPGRYGGTAWIKSG